MIIHARIDWDGGGGGGSMASNVKKYTIPRRKGPLEHRSDLIFYVMKDHVHIGKNRYNGATGDVTVDEFMNIVLEYFAKNVYNDIAVVFQEGLVKDLREAISNVLNENLLKLEVKDDTFCRTRSGDGT